MGAMNKPLFDIDRPSLQAEVDSYVPGSGLSWRTFFPLKYTPRFDLHGLEGEDGIPVTADRIAFDVKAPTKTRKTIGSWSGELAKIAISRDKNEKQINEYNDLTSIANAADTDKDAKKYLVDMVYDDVKFCNDGMDYKVELDALRIGSHGVQDFPATIDGDNATADVINFNVPAENFFGVTAANKKWSAAATADGIADIVRMQKAIIKKGHRRPNFAIMEQAAFDYLTQQTATLNRLSSYNAFTGGSAILSPDAVDLGVINNYMAKKGYPTILVIDSYATVEAKNGEQTTMKPWAENVCVLSPTVQLGWTYYKGVPDVKDTDALQVHGAYYKMTRYSELNPMKEVTMAEAYVQCALINRASLCFLNTENTSWNGGSID